MKRMCSLSQSNGKVERKERFKPEKKEKKVLRFSFSLFFRGTIVLQRLFDNSRLVFFHRCEINATKRGKMDSSKIKGLCILVSSNFRVYTFGTILSGFWVKV